MLTLCGRQVRDGCVCNTQLSDSKQDVCVQEVKHVLPGRLDGASWHSPTTGTSPTYTPKPCCTE